MSVAYDYAYEYVPGIVIPEPPCRALYPPVRPARPRHKIGARDAEVIRLFAPAPSRQVRLTRRGVLALAALVATLATTLVLLAWLNAPAGAALERSSGPVTVRPGDTLWAIAERVAPGTDPRAEVDQLRRLNGLAGPQGVQLVPGQVLRTR